MTDSEHRAVSPLRCSEELHQAVLQYASRDTFDRAEFERIAGELYAFQGRCQRPASAPRSSSPFPGVTPVTTDVFRFSTPFNFSSDDAQATFRTSGTTTPHPGRHRMRSTETYRKLALAYGRRCLLGPSLQESGLTVLALLPLPASPVASSLTFMCAEFMAEFDGRGLDDRRSESFERWDKRRWLLTEDGVRMHELSERLTCARAAEEPVLLLTTSFALVMLLDAIGAGCLPLPPGSTIMTTGGFKGRTREVSAADLYRAAFEKLKPARIIGEYGMTELSSQLYEKPSYSADEQGGQGLYFEPSWLRVFPLHPVTHRPVPAGDVGLACFVDLANVDSAVCVLTQDLVRRERSGVRLLGRAPGAIVRGCSLAVEELWEAPSAQVRAPVRSAINPSVGAESRVRRLLQAGATIKDPASSYGRKAREQWGKDSPWPPEAIELGLELSLESGISDEQIRQFCAGVEPAPQVWVNLSGNMPVAAQRAIALALAASERVFVRASRREPVLAACLQEASRGPDGTTLFELVGELRPVRGDHVFAYGEDSTLELIRKQLPVGTRFHPHGSGIGAVVLYPEDDLLSAAQGVALDMVLFDQQGCLSPRVAILQNGANAGAFAHALARELVLWEARVPRSETCVRLSGELAWSRATFQRIGEVVEAGEGFIALSREPEPLLLAPAARNLVLYCCAEPLELVRQLAPRLTTVGTVSSERQERLRGVAPNARRTQIGSLQRPAFDGPVDQRGS